MIINVILKLLLVYVFLEMIDRYVIYIWFDCFFFFIKGESNGGLGVRKSIKIFCVFVLNCVCSIVIEVLEVRF